MPDTNLTSLSEIALEIARNSAAQHRNNQARMAALRRYSSGDLVRVFDQVPVLLHVNDPEAVGYVPDPETPHGLHYLNRQIWRLPADRDPGLHPAGRPVVEGLYLIGSSGSVGSNQESDLDYWICFEDGAFTPRGFELFQRKLAGIKEWADRECGVDTNFYCINLADLALGRITHLEDAETEGEVAPLLLLEEFYRTFILVAGRMPLWPILPQSLTLDDYKAIAALAREAGVEFLDLGFPALPKPQQILAAALWLAHKSEADPLKGLIKLTVLLEYVEKDFQCPLLCAEVKEVVLKASEADFPIDPYVLTIERVTSFGQALLSPIQLEFLRSAAVLKVLGATAGQPAPLPPDSPKRRLLEEWLERWGWPQERLDHFAAYSLWTERGRLELSQEVLHTLVRLYIRIANRLTSHYTREVDPQSKELAPFAARLLTRQAGLETTLESLPSKRHHSALGGRLILRPEPESKLWTLHALTAEDEVPGTGNIIYASHRAARVAAWLIHNQFAQEQIDNLELRPAEDGLTMSLDDLPGLLVEMAAFFPPLDLSREGTIWAVRPQGLVLLILNFEEPQAEDDDITAVDLISRTGWGEMRHEHLGLGQLESKADRYLKIAQTVLKGGEIRPEDLAFHSRAFSPQARQATVNIRGALTALVKRQAESANSDPRSRNIDL